MRKILTLLIGFAICTSAIISCNSKKNTEEANTATEVYENTQSETASKSKSKPKAYLPNETVSVLQAGAGFRGAIVRARLESEHSRNFTVHIAIYARGEKVGQTWVTIPKGELEGEEETRLDGFMGWFEDRIPSTVKLKIISVSEGY